MAGRENYGIKRNLSNLSLAKRAVEYIIELIYPESCIFCREPVERNSPERYICRNCLDDLPELPFDERLKERYDEPDGCYEIPGLSIYEYRSIRDTIFRFKYDGFKRYGRILGEIMADYVLENDLKMILEADMVVPVPLWKGKEKTRGFNQAALMAERFSEITGIPYADDIIIRVRDTVPQSSLRRHQRNANISSAFRVIDEDRVRDKKILLLDDIYTTGSTIKECAKNFYVLGAERVMYIALAGSEEHDEDI